MTLTPSEVGTLHLLVAVVVPLVVGFLAVVVGPWVVWVAFSQTKKETIK